MPPASLPVSCQYDVGVQEASDRREDHLDAARIGNNHILVHISTRVSRLVLDLLGAATSTVVSDKQRLLLRGVVVCWQVEEIVTLSSAAVDGE